jgi:hypothetical protein
MCGLDGGGKTETMIFRKDNASCSLTNGTDALGNEGCRSRKLTVIKTTAAMSGRELSKLERRMGDVRLAH